MTGEGVGRTILLVGHCRPDESMLRSAIASLLPGAVLVPARDDRTLKSLAPSADLLLINRVLDGDFADADGQSLIEGCARGGRARAMLVSNLAPAQERAVSAGAAPGFGKSELRSAKMRDALRAALGL